jgi:hypothetical protein
MFDQDHQIMVFLIALTRIRYHQDRVFLLLGKPPVPEKRHLQVPQIKKAGIQQASSQLSELYAYLGVS